MRPALVAHCYECHSAQAKKLGGSLLLDSRDGLRKGGDSGASIVPGQPDESLLIAAVRYSPDSVHMPPKGKLPADVIAAFEAWVKMGAPDPREDSPAAGRQRVLGRHLRRARLVEYAAGCEAADPRRARRRLVALGRSTVSFARALDERGLTPAPAAEPRTLARRLSLVLTGLPPTAEQMAEFLATGRRPSVARIFGVRPSSDSSIVCWRRLIMANGSRGIGWMSCVSRKLMATSGTTRFITPGAIAIT